MAINVNVDGNAVQQISNSISNFFKSLWNQPTWLKALVVIAMAIGAAYFSYNYFDRTESINELENQVNELSCVVNKHLGIEELIYIITEIKILEAVLQENYDERMYELESLIFYFESVDPLNPIILNLKSIKTRMEINRDSYNQHYLYIMKELNKIVENDSIK